MLDLLRPLAVFARTVETGSFRGAARACGLSPSVVSHHIAQLEAQLGVALLYRSTRRLSLTRDGERLFAAARQMLEAARSGLDSMVPETAQPIGELGITAPAVLAAGFLPDDIAAFAKAYPQVALNLNFTDTPRDLIGDGIDVAIRMGNLKDSTLKARRLRGERRVLVASVDYMAGRALPQEPEDLPALDWIRLRPRPPKAVLSRDGQTRTIAYESRLVVDDAKAVYRLARAGLGLAVLPSFLAREDLASGTMIELLPEWRLETVGVYAVWPPNAPRESLTGLFVRFLEERNRTAPDR